MTEYNIDRAEREKHSIDALGKKWNIKVNKQNGLCHARPEPDREDAVIPKEFEGQWTKPSLLGEQIKVYVQRSWDHAEKVQQAAERKAIVFKEAQHAKAKEEKAKEAREREEAKADNDAPKAQAKAGSKPTKKEVKAQA